MGRVQSPAQSAEIRAESVKAVFQRTPSAALATVVNAALMTAVLITAEHVVSASIWFSLVVGLTCLRLCACVIFRRAAPTPEQMRPWAIVSAGAALLSGLLWGGGALLLFPQSETYQLLWAFVIGGMCAGAAALHSAHAATALAYILPATLLTATRFGAEGSPHGIVAAAMIVVFALVLTVNSLRASRQFAAMVKLQLNLAQRTRELDATNARLRSEIAEHRATETALHHAQKMEAIGQLTGGIAHDFNNLLTAVLGNLELLRKRIPADDARSVQLLDNAEQGAERGAALTQRLLAFGRRQALRPAPVDVAALVRGMSELLRSSLGAHVRIASGFPPALPPARVDANQLELAILNLALNARDAMPGGGDLTITARTERVAVGAGGGLADGTYVVITVLDTGEGMDELTLSRAMEPFFTTKGMGKGTGLGLPMVHGLAAQSGGQLVLHSRRGEGTRAELWLPVAAERAVSKAAMPPPQEPPPAGSLSVLLVDDDPLVLASTAAILEDLEHTVIAAESGARALEILRGGAHVDLIITDYAMPEMSGVELAEAVRWFAPDMPVLLATGYSDLDDDAAAGIVRLAKPFGRNALARAIEARLRAPPASRKHRDAGRAMAATGHGT